MSQATIISEKSTFSLVATEKPKLQNLTFPQSRSGSLQGYDVQESPMLHTKFRGNQPPGSGEDFERFLQYI